MPPAPTKPISLRISKAAHEHLDAVQKAIGGAIGVASLPQPAALEHIILETAPSAAAASYVRRLAARNGPPEPQER